MLEIVMPNRIYKWKSKLVALKYAHLPCPYAVIPNGLMSGGCPVIFYWWWAFCTLSYSIYHTIVKCGFLKYILYISLYTFQNIWCNKDSLISLIVTDNSPVALPNTKFHFSNRSSPSNNSKARMSDIAYVC